MRKLLNMIIFSAEREQFHEKIIEYDNIFSGERTISCENIIAFKKIICAEKMFSIEKTNLYGKEFV